MCVLYFRFLFFPLCSQRQIMCKAVSQREHQWKKGCRETQEKFCFPWFSGLCLIEPNESTGIVNNNYKDKKSLHLLTHFPKPVPVPSWGAGDAITIYPKICMGRMLDMLVRSENQSQMWGVAILTGAARSNTHLGDFF